MSKWDELTMAEKAEMMKVAVRNGITNLQDIRDKYNEFAEGGEIEANTFKGGGYKPSDSVKKRISTWEGAAMTGAMDPLSGKWGKNRSFEAEADSFYNALPASIREQVLSNPELADNLYSYSYNVGAGNFKKRVVPALERYYTGNGSPEEIANSMWASGDKKLRGLRNRRAVERKGVVDALTPAFVSEPIDNTFMPNPFTIQVENTYQRPIIVPDEGSYVTAHEVSPSEQRAQKARETFDAINRFNTIMNMLNIDANAPTYMPNTGNPFLDAIGVLTNSNANGGRIHIKPENRGKFTALKKRTGHSATWFKQHGTPAQKKMAVFALNSRHWKHALGGNLFDGTTEDSQQMAIQRTPNVDLAVSNPWLFNKLNPPSYVSPEEQAVKRANRVFSNYDEAKDSPLSTIGTAVRNFIRYEYEQGVLPRSSGISNCTLSVSQWVDPNNPLKNASSIYNTPEKYNYTPINAEDAVPGNVVVARNPNNGTFHTMMVEKFADHDGIYNFDGVDYPYKKGDPLMVYSRGGHNANAIRRGVPLYVFTENSKGKTENRFYRYNYPNEVFLPEVVIKPNKKK